MVRHPRLETTARWDCLASGNLRNPACVLLATFSPSSHSSRISGASPTGIFKARLQELRRSPSLCLWLSVVQSLCSSSCRSRASCSQSKCRPVQGHVCPPRQLAVPSSGPAFDRPLKSNYKGFPACQAKTGHDESRSVSSMERQPQGWCTPWAAKTFLARSMPTYRMLMTSHSESVDEISHSPLRRSVAGRRCSASSGQGSPFHWLGITNVPAFSNGSIALLLGAFLSAAAAIAHLACIAIGAPAYRFMGAGERMARAAEAGQLKPTLVTLAVAGVLFAWAAFALSGAGVVGPLPLTKLVLVAISIAYLGRAVAFPLIKSSFPGNSCTFWLVSSGICGLIGLVHAYGTVSLWRTL